MKTKIVMIGFKRNLQVGFLSIVCLLLIVIVVYNQMKESENAENGSEIITISKQMTLNSEIPQSIMNTSQPSQSFNSHITVSDKTESDSPYPLAKGFTLIDIDGMRFTLNEFRGRIVIIDFMGTSCRPCMRQAAELRKTYISCNDSVEILSISIFRGKGMIEKLHSFADFFKIHWRLATDEEGVAYMYQVKTIPTTFIIDKNGYIRFKHEGLVESSIILQEVNHILEEK